MWSFLCWIGRGIVAVANWLWSDAGGATIVTIAANQRMAAIAGI